MINLKVVNRCSKVVGREGGKNEDINGEMGEGEREREGGGVTRL